MSFFHLEEIVYQSSDQLEGLIIPISARLIVIVSFAFLFIGFCRQGNFIGAKFIYRYRMLLVKTLQTQKS